MKIRLCAIALFAFSLALTALAPAQSAGGGAVSEGHREAILTFLTVAKQQEQYETGMVAGFENSMKDAAANMPVEQREAFMRGMERVKTLMLDKMGWSVMKEEFLKLYAATFTKEEVEAVIPLFEDPAMQKFLTKQMNIMPMAMQLATEKTKTLQPEIMQIMQEEMTR